MKLTLFILMLILSSLAYGQKRGYPLLEDTYLIVNKSNIKIETWSVTTANRILKAVEKDGKIRLKKFTAESKKTGILYDLYFSHEDFFDLQNIIKEIDSTIRASR